MILKNPVSSPALAHPIGSVEELSQPPSRALPASPRQTTPSLEDLVRVHETRVRRLVHRLTGWTAKDTDPEDLVQDVFVKAFEALPTFRGEAALSTWLTRITLSTCRAHNRKQALRRLFWRRWQPEEPTTTPDHEQTERAHQILSAVRTLPPNYREVIILRYLEELDLPEVAEALNLSKNATEVRLHRARTLLAEKLAHLQEEPR